MMNYSLDMEEVLILLGTKTPRPFHVFWKPALRGLKRRSDVLRVYGSINTYGITATGEVALQLILMKRARGVS